MYRFHQLLSATHSPHKALQESTPSAAMLGGIFMEAVVAAKLGFAPWLPDGIEMDEQIFSQYDLQANRVIDLIRCENLVYQPEFPWPSDQDARAEGHPDFCIFPDFENGVDGHIIDLKTTEYPTEELLQKLIHSIQMCAYIAAYERLYAKPPKLSIILASRLVEPESVSFNKNGTVSLSGQNADYAQLKEAVELMGEKADDRHWALVYKAPVWNPVIQGTIEADECHELAKIGTILLDAGLAILDTGLSESVFRPYA
jgi:hypothetical protein